MLSRLFLSVKPKVSGHVSWRCGRYEAYRAFSNTRGFNVTDTGFGGQPARLLQLSAGSLMRSFQLVLNATARLMFSARRSVHVNEAFAPWTTLVTEYAMSPVSLGVLLYRCIPTFVRSFNRRRRLWAFDMTVNSCVFRRRSNTAARQIWQLFKCNIFYITWNSTVQRVTLIFAITIIIIPRG